MGLPVGLRNIAIPRVLLYLALVVAYLETGIYWFLSGLGLCEAPQEEINLWREFSEISSAISSSSGQMIKRRLSVITFRKVAEKLIKIEEDFVCAVCLSSFEEDDEIRELRNCSHIFHRNCLDKWIDNNQDTCPFCRCALYPQIQSVDK
ncbi:hypothetical protein SUGI_0542160 [Cryptomeria japonica]|uniref:brassinosteroid-responsive RING protein 1 n=1 Tax=Cryptomeria japonica TaxID=3369 RepID=UPI002408B96D|nr:brassinosteroid-responsive RING protein 1 [Cryptomeria japonica]GLJ27630.1 hypothetical protein SUGI_0542160 [Cryptomeria japonica]